MSDRRPENPRLVIETLCEHGWVSPHADGQGSELRDGEVVITWDVECSGGSRTEASPADLLAAVRRGVESGEIDGEVAESVGVTFAQMADGKDGLILAVNSREWTVEPSRSYLVIPVLCEPI